MSPTPNNDNNTMGFPDKPVKSKEVRNLADYPYKITRIVKGREMPTEGKTHIKIEVKFEKRSVTVSKMIPTGLDSKLHQELANDMYDKCMVSNENK